MSEKVKSKKEKGKKGKGKSKTRTGTFDVSLFPFSLLLAFSLLLPAGTAQAEAQAEWEAAIAAGNPLHWYRFDEAGGADCLDSGSGKLNGAYNGPLPGQEGLFGPTSAAIFDRKAGTDRANFVGAANLAGPWTVEYIVMSTKAAAANDSMALHDSDTTSVRLAGWTSLGEVGFTLYGVADYRFTPAAGYTLQNLVAPKDQWLHLVFRNNGAGTQVFINGKLMGTSTDKVDLPRLRIGGRGAGPADWLQGILDEAVVFDRALSDADILAHANPITGAIALWAAKARNPTPADGALAVGMPLLQWKPGAGAVLHNVYLGTSPDLTEADRVATRIPFAMHYHAAGLQPGAMYYWRVDEIDAAGTITTGNVWTFVAQALTAYHPSPADGANDVSPAPVLTWLPGQAVIKHHLYFGDDAAAVGQGAAGTDKGELADPTFTPGALESLSIYHWRVDEIAAGGVVRTGPVWKFTTYLPVDDFETYTDAEGKRIYETWIDGWTNGTGSTVGNTTAPFAERTIVRSGKQALPLDYNNIASPFYSEAEREFAPVEDWTANGADTLVLHVRGRAGNAAASLYVAVEDSTKRLAVVTYPDPKVTGSAKWIQWK
ncbi:MAG: LamG domain-containing protein, partial [Planctomycetes bacterium]|nr:LamG domain-containing protein [Planctomycetota bacterium]